MKQTLEASLVTPTTVVIADAISDDIPSLTVLLAQLFGIEADFAANTDKQSAGLSLLLASPESAVIKVARTDSGQVVGMVSAQLVISTAEGAASAWIEDMVVAPTFQGQGIGARLLQAALTWATSKGATRAQLLCDTGNSPAVAFYTKQGWQTSSMAMRRKML